MFASISKFLLFIQYAVIINVVFFFKFGFTPCKAEQRLQGMEFQEKETQKD